MWGGKHSLPYDLPTHFCGVAYGQVTKFKGNRIRKAREALSPYRCNSDATRTRGVKMIPFTRCLCHPSDSVTSETPQTRPNGPSIIQENASTQPSNTKPSKRCSIRLPC